MRCAANRMSAKAKQTEIQGRYCITTYRDARKSFGTSLRGEEPEALGFVVGFLGLGGSPGVCEMGHVFIHPGVRD